ncbi:MAG: 4Fe-4S binding protein [Rhodospirillales bacterium]|jgi:ferredoxin|nr:4Fe-4S binding protein [Rhodospirillales bacterium]
MISPLGGHALEALTPETAVAVDRSRCVRHRCTRNECRKCLDVCPTDAITWSAPGDNPGLSVNPDACTQCLRCLAVCPTAALKSPELSLPRILSELAAHAAPVLGCGGQPATEAHARMPCLGYLAHPEVMALLGLVYPEGLQINLTSCGDCANGHMVDGVREAHARLRDLVPGHRIEMVHEQGELDFQAPSLSRRQLFTFFRERTTRAAVTMVARLQSEKSQSYGNKQVPATRALLLKAMEGMPGESRRNIANQLFGRISFTPQCIRSEGCVGVCPTGAIQPADDDTQPPFFDGDLCVACNSCQAFCRNQGVTVLPS